MDYGKIDAALAAALEDAQDTDRRDLTVFVRTTHSPTGDEAAVLRRLGVTGDVDGRQVFSATLSANTVDELSEQPWVQSIQLSNRLRPLGR